MLEWICSFIIGLIERLFLYHAPGDATYYDETVHAMPLASGGEAAYALCYHAMWLRPADIPDGVPLVVFFHGNSTSLRGMSLCIKELSVGLNAVLVPVEYANYVNDRARSPMAATETETLLAEAVAFCAALHEAHPRSPLFLMGHSLGTGVAIHVATTSKLAPVVRGVVLVSPYLSIISVVNHALATWLRPVDVLCSYQRVAALQCPMLSFAGTSDRLIAPWHSSRLFALQGKQDNTQLIPGADHNDTIVPRTLPRIVGAVSSFIAHCSN